MQIAHDLSEVEARIADTTPLLLYLSGNTCTVCASLLPKVAQIAQRVAPSIQCLEVPMQHIPEAAGRFMALSVPVILLYVQGKEVMRMAGIIDTGALEHAMHRSLHGV